MNARDPSDKDGGAGARRSPGDLVRFLAAGTLNFVVTLLAFYTLVHVVRANYHLSLALTWVVAVLLNYIVHLSWVFRVTKRPKADRTLVEYLLAYLVTYLMNWLMLTVLVEIVKLDPLIGQFIAMPFVVAFNFLVIRFLVLRSAARARLASGEPGRDGSCKSDPGAA